MRLAFVANVFQALAGASHEFHKTFGRIGNCINWIGHNVLRRRDWGLRRVLQRALELIGARNFLQPRDCIDLVDPGHEHLVAIRFKLAEVRIDRELVCAGVSRNRFAHLVMRSGKKVRSQNFARI